MSEEKAREFWIDYERNAVLKDEPFGTGSSYFVNVIEKSAYDSLQKENEELKHEILELKEDLGFTKSQLKRAWKSIRSHVSKRRFYRKENEALKARLVKAKEVMKAVNKCFTPPCVVDSKKCICRGKSVIGENYDPGNFDPDCYVYFEIEKAFKDLEAGE